MPRWHQWTAVQKEAIGNDYRNGCSIRTLAQTWRVNPHSIAIVLQKQQVPTRSPNQVARSLAANYRFFQHIDTEEKAYWLGFFVADGCMTTQNRVVFCLSMRDKEHLERLRHACTAEQQVKTYGAKASLTFCSSEMIADLQALGIHRDKTRRTVIPLLPLRFYRHFWRGVFDGDGCVSHGKSGLYRKQLILTLVGQYVLVSAFQQQTIGLSQSRAKIAFSSRIWRYSLSGTGADRVFRWLYADATICLERKRSKGHELSGERSAGAIA